MSEVNFSLETSKMQAVAEALPERMREPFMWFAGFFARDCLKNPDVLETKLKALKLDTTPGSFVKILRGRWNHSAPSPEHPEGEKCAPVLALENFLQIVERLRKDSQFAEQAGKVAFIETGTTRLIFDFIDGLRDEGDINGQKEACQGFGYHAKICHYG